MKHAEKFEWSVEMLMEMEMLNKPIPFSSSQQLDAFFTSVHPIFISQQLRGIKKLTKSEVQLLEVVQTLVERNQNGVVIKEGDFPRM
ncbi:unnamed protein product [Caenorhabditis nigoni]